MAQLDNIIHQAIRLQIMSSLAALEAGEQVDFVYLRKILNLTDGNLGAHLAKLEDAGYVKIEKTFIARKPRTFINATGKGRDAFNEYIATLKRIIGSTKIKKGNISEQVKSI
jgi:DNA-binding MarR family transcriptional regulator